MVEYYLTSDYEIMCFSAEHLKWVSFLVLPQLIFWLILFPGVILYYLVKNSSKLDESSIKETLCFFYWGFKRDHYYWEFVILLRKYLIIVITIFIPMISNILGPMLIEIIFLISLKMQFEKSPYKYDTLNKLENIGLVSLTYLNFVGLYSVMVKNNPLDIAIIIISFLSLLL